MGEGRGEGYGRSIDPNRVARCVTFEGPWLWVPLGQGRQDRIGRKRMKTFIAALLMLALAGAAAAQDWPTRPVTMVVPFAAGGPVDLVGRLFAQRLTEVLGQQVIIENVGGAGGSAGALRVAKAAPDGREFLLGNSGTHT